MTKQKWIFFILVFLASCATSKRVKQVANNGTRYNVENTKEDKNTVTGLASYYAEKYHGRKTANGEIYNMYGLTAAHPFYKFDTKLRITNLLNNKSVVVRVNDRMPKHKERIIDLSYGAAKALDMIREGVAKVQIEILNTRD